MKTCMFSLFIAAATALPAFQSIKGFPVKTDHVVRRQSKIIPVVVGGAQVIFVPNSVTAAVGDVIMFQFSNGNHTVTQSTADAACKPMEAGVNSGNVPFSDGQTEVGTFNMPVTTTEPMFLYCSTGPHCQLGQVMVINPKDTAQVAGYARLSQEAAENVAAKAVVGGTVGKIPLEQAAFAPAPPKEAAPPPPANAAPPAEAAPPAAKASAPPAAEASSPPAAMESAATEGAAAETTAPGTITVLPAAVTDAAHAAVVVIKAPAAEAAAMPMEHAPVAAAAATPTSFVF